MQTGRLLTIGYGNKSHIEIFSWLQRNSTQILVDVRTKPYSQFRPEFNRNKLLVSLPAIGIEYVYKGEALGGLSLNEKEQQETLYQQGIDFLIERLKSGQTVAIMCCEADVRNCHRYKIADEIFKRGYIVIHIGKQGELIIHEGLLF